MNFGFRVELLLELLLELMFELVRRELLELGEPFELSELFEFFDDRPLFLRLELRAGVLAGVLAFDARSLSRFVL